MSFQIGRTMNKSVSLGLLCVCALFASAARAQSPGMPSGSYPPANIGGAPQIRQSFYNTPQQPVAAPSNTAAPVANGSASAGWFTGPDARVAANPTAATNSPTAESTSSEEGKIPVRSLLQMFHDGGIMMYPIALCSFVLMVFSFERFISLRTGRVIPRPFVKRLIEQLQQQQIDRDEALELCERNPSSIATLLAAAVKRYGRPAVEIEQAVLDAGERETNNLRRHMRLLNAISNVAPLLGLLGTVMGMIQSFNDISGSQAMGRPEMLAGESAKHC